MLLSICKEITYLASDYLSISIRFLKASVNMGIQHLSYLPCALCILHLSLQKIPSLLWTFALLSLSLSRKRKNIYFSRLLFLHVKLKWGRLRHWVLLLEESSVTCSASLFPGGMRQLTSANTHDTISMSESWLAKLAYLRLRSMLVSSLFRSINKAIPECGKVTDVIIKSHVQVNILTF